MLLAVPFLESLLPRTASAGSPFRRKYFVSMMTAHGGVWAENMFPGDAMLTESRTYAGRTVRRGALAASPAGNQPSLSPVLTAASARLTPALLAKMNVIAGFDMPRHLGHHTGGHLGNYARNDANDGTPTGYGYGKEIPTIDQVMAYSSGFYPDLSTILKRSMQLGQSNHVSAYWANPTTKTGPIQFLNGTADTQAVFDEIFVKTPPSGTSQRAPAVDGVVASYRSLLQSNRRLSTSDRRRLEDHIARLAEIQRRLKVVVSCGGIARPTLNAKDFGWQYPGPSGPTSVQAFQLLNDLIVAGFLCGSSCIATVDATMHASGPFTEFANDWHGQAHLSTEAASGTSGPAENNIVRGNQGFFELAFLDLVAKLDTDDGSGSGHTILDDALVAWTQECSSLTHAQASIPIIMAGGAGGALRTGSYIDYRNRSKVIPLDQKQSYSPGLVWNQWLGSALQAMGVPRAEYEIPLYQPSRPAGVGTGGYGWFDDVTDGGDPGQAGDHNSAFAVLGEIPAYLAP